MVSFAPKTAETTHVIKKSSPDSKIGIVLGKEDDGPIFVNSISADGLAAAAGLRVGDNVVSVRGISPSSASDATQLLKKSEGDIAIAVSRVAETMHAVPAHHPVPAAAVAPLNAEAALDPDTGNLSADDVAGCWLTCCFGCFPACVGLGSRRAAGQPDTLMLRGGFCFPGCCWVTHVRNGGPKGTLYTRVGDGTRSNNVFKVDEDAGPEPVFALCFDCICLFINCYSLFHVGGSAFASTTREFDFADDAKTLRGGVYGSKLCSESECCFLF